MLQEVLRANIETKLNANTVATVSSPSNNVLFVMGQYYQDETQEPNESDFIYNIENGYKTIDATYVPCSMRFQAEYTPLYGTKTGSATIPVDFFVAYDVDFQSKLTALNQVIASIVGNVEDVVDDTDTYHTVWNMTALTDMGKVFVFNGTRFIGITTTISIEFSDSFHYGNEYTIELNEQDINFISFKSERVGQEDVPQILGDTEAKGGVQTNARTYTLSCYVDAYISALLDGWETAYAQDTVYQIEYDSPTLSAPLELSVRIKDYVYNLEKGEKVSVTISFIMSDTAFVETSYAITYVLNGGVNNVGNPATFTQDDVPVTLLAPTRSGATFAAWYEEAGFTNVITQLTALAADTVYAKWNLITYTVTYNLDGGTNNGSNPATFDVYDLPITLADATKAFFTFGGWFSEAGGAGTEYTGITTIGNKVFYAYWI